MPEKPDVTVCLGVRFRTAGLLARAGGAGPLIKEERLSPPFRW